MGRSLLLFVFIIAAFFKLGARHQPEQQTPKTKVGTTTIFLVRHAEKVTANPADEDPDLTAAGVKRARDLQQYLAGTPVDAFFSTRYKRSQRTLSYLAKGQPVQFYDAHDYEALRARVLGDFRGKTVVVVGHSNTLLPLIEAFGAKRPLKLIADHQYDHIFKLQVSPQGKASVQAFRYGAPQS
jgi:2,3-bisphosphoglycerate-dependent phosphoglycerate mutase